MTNKPEIHLYTPASYSKNDPSKNGWIETREVPEKNTRKIQKIHHEFRT